MAMLLLFEMLVPFGRQFPFPRAQLQSLGPVAGKKNKTKKKTLYSSLPAKAARIVGAEMTRK